MARLYKSGLDYLPLDVDLDESFELIEARHGLEGFAILIKLYQRVYRNGYFAPWGEREILLFSNKINVDINSINVIINSALEFKLFNEKLFKEHGILTSRGIQKRYFEIVKRRKKVECNINYLLIDISEYHNIINVTSEGINVTSTGINVNINSQSKVKKSKENIIKEEEEEIDSENDVDEIQTLWVRTISRYPNMVEREMTEKLIKDFGKSDVERALRETAARRARAPAVYAKAILNGTEKTEVIQGFD